MEFVSIIHLCNKETKIQIMKTLLTLIFLSAFLGSFAQDKWETLCKEKPQTALQEARKLFEKARKTDNSPEMLQALIIQIRCQTAIDRDSMPALIQKTENILQNSNNPVEQSILHSLLADLYLNYYNYNRYQINQRTPLADYIPEHINEWSRNLFYDQISRHALDALQPQNLLKQTPATAYKPILLLGKDSRSLRPTLLDFIGYRSIDQLKQLENSSTISQTAVDSLLVALPFFLQQPLPGSLSGYTLNILKIYQRLLHAGMSSSNPEALLCAELSRLHYIKNLSYGNDSLYLERLQELVTQYDNQPLIVEAIAQIAQTKLIDRNNTDTETVYPEIIALCQKYIQKYPTYARINLLKQIIQTINRPELSVQYNDYIYPGQSLVLQASYYRAKEIQLDIYRIKETTEAYYKTGNDSSSVNKQLFFSKKYTLPSRYVKRDTTFRIPISQSGLYEIVLRSPNSKKIVNTFICNSLFTVSQKDNQKITFIVRDRMSGAPVSDARIRIFAPISGKYRNYRQITEIRTNKQGQAVYNSSKSQINYEVINDRNPNGPISSEYYYTPQPNKASYYTDIFTDRPIYRPGQTVSFYGIAWTRTPDSTYIEPNRSYEVTLSDPNRQIINKCTVKTNEWGSFNGSFTIPPQTLNGEFRLNIAGKGYAYITVAEYKRPQLELILHPQKDSYAFGEQIRLTGKVKTYSGVSLQNIPISYEITLQSFYPRLNASETVITGETQSDPEGNFSFSFQAQKPVSSYYMNSYYYNIKLTATDTKGESQEIIQRLPIQDAFYKLTILGKTYVNKQDKNHFYIQAVNAVNEKISRTISYSISKLQPLTSLKQSYNPDSARIEKTLYRGELNTLTDSLYVDFSSWQSGAYILIAQEKTREKDTVTTKKIFYLYSGQDIRPPYLTYEWLVKNTFTARPGEDIEINFGTSARNVYLLYELYTDKGLITQKQTVLSDTILRLKIPYEKTYGSNFCVNLSFVKDDQFFNNNVRIYKSIEDKKLDIHTQVFRDKLIPGQSETWEFSIRNTQGQGEIAEIAAVMYDLSLEKFKFHAWDFQPDFYFRTNCPAWAYKSNHNSVAWFSFPYRPDKYPDFVFDRLNYYGYDFHPLIVYSVENMLAVKQEVYITEYASDMEASPAPIRENSANLKTRQKNAGHGQQEDASSSGDYTRENFAETAFFYPHLVSTDSGTVKLHFTVPETLTRWKFIALAHTKDLAYGKIEKEITTQKELSVMPNIPRFFRNGDQTVLKATINNLSSGTLQGEAILELFNPTDNTVVLQRKTDFRTEAGKSSTVDFEFAIPQNTSILGCRIIARTPDFSDGEQHLIPVLPDRILLTDALAFYATEKGKHRFEMQPASKTKQDYRLTLEVTANPLWYAVQALPRLQEAQNDNITDLAAAFYTNTIGHSIVKSNPAIATALKIWKMTASSNTLLSKLEQNSELKSILLEATPWVLDAQNETERIQSLSQFFDLNRLNDLQNRSLQKMADLQNEKGGWSWFKGMPASHFMTYNVLTIMAKASLSGQREAGEKEKFMQMKALRYIDQELIKNFTAQDTTLTHNRLLYLYTRSFYTDIPLGDALSIHKSLLKQLNRQWPDLSVYEKALAAIVLSRYGQKENAERILSSLKEYATLRPDQGMFWANNRSGYYTNSAILIHTTIMEAFHEIQGNTPDIDLMKQWLLRQKQTQNWGDVPSTVDAIYALLLTGKRQLDEPEHLTIAVGKKEVSIPENDNVFGYIKQTYTAEEITPDMSTVTLDKIQDSPTWGALYLQYFEQLKQVRKKKNTTLQIDKKLFIEKTTAKGKELLPVNKELHLGDKIIVRLTVTLDRDMEYLHIKDLRAACFEPVEQISGNQWKYGTCYYEEIKDGITNFFIHYLAKGSYTFEYALWVNQEGTYQDGLATIQCLYAPEFVSHSTTTNIKVN